MVYLSIRKVGQEEGSLCSSIVYMKLYCSKWKHQSKFLFFFFFNRQADRKLVPYGTELGGVEFIKDFPHHFEAIQLRTGIKLQQGSTGNFLQHRVHTAHAIKPCQGNAVNITLTCQTTLTVMVSLQDFKVMPLGIIAAWGCWEIWPSISIFAKAWISQPSWSRKRISLWTSILIFIWNTVLDIQKGQEWAIKWNITPYQK